MASNTEVISIDLTEEEVEVLNRLTLDRLRAKLVIDSQSELFEELLQETMTLHPDDVVAATMLAFMKLETNQLIVEVIEAQLDEVKRNGGIPD